MQHADAILTETFRPAHPQNLGAAKSPDPTIRDRSAKQRAFGPGEQPPLKIVSRSTQTRASNVARALLVVANVPPIGYRVGIFMADHSRYATPADIRRNVSPGEIFCYWPQAKIAAKMGCSERQVRRGVRYLRESATMEVRQRVRPCEASYVFVQPVGSGVRSVGSRRVCRLAGLSGLMSGLMSGLIQNHRRTTREAAAARARESAASAAGAHGRPRLGRSATSAATNPARDRAPRPRTRGRTTTGGVRNCPQCHTFDRGHDDRCEHCDWTREAWDARGAT